MPLQSFDFSFYSEGGESFLQRPTSGTPNRNIPILIPNLHMLGLLGKLDIDSDLFKAVIRPRTMGSAPHCAKFQSFHIHIGSSRNSVKLGGLEEIKDIRGERADIQVVQVSPLRSLAFPDLSWKIIVGVQRG